MDVAGEGLKTSSAESFLKGDWKVMDAKAAPEMLDDFMSKSGPMTKEPCISFRAVKLVTMSCLQVCAFPFHGSCNFIHGFFPSSCFAMLLVFLSSFLSVPFASWFSPAFCYNSLSFLFLCFFLSFLVSF